MKRSFFFNLLIIIALCAVLYALFFISLDFITRHGIEVKVPDVQGQDLNTAVGMLQKAGFDIAVDSAYDPEKKPLQVLDQQPSTDAVVKEGRTIFLTVNKTQPPNTAMPNLVGLSFRSAALLLASNRLLLGDTVYRPDIAKGAILEQLLNGQAAKVGDLVPQGSKINLVIGDGLGNTEMDVPDLIGMTYAQAIATLSVSDLYYTAIWEPDITDSANAIIYNQQPSGINEAGLPNHIREGDEIGIYIKQNPTAEELEHNRNAHSGVNVDSL
jgi:beta-lactam-binding protein with PASTA domain